MPQDNQETITPARLKLASQVVVTQVNAYRKAVRTLLERADDGSYWGPEAIADHEAMHRAAARLTAAIERLSQLVGNLPEITAGTLRNPDDH